VNAQFQEFATNPFSAPESILHRHLSNQGNGFRGYPRLTRSGLRLALPDQTKELTMPTQECVWLNDEEGLFPGSNQPGEEDEERSIRLAANWLFHLPTENDELLA